jgi:hypothetical protein
MKSVRSIWKLCLGLAVIGPVGEELGAGVAHAGLTGYTVSGGFAFNETGGPFDSGAVFTPTGSTTVPGTISGLDIDQSATFAADSFQMSLGSGTNFAPISFVGYIFETEASAPAFTGVTILSATNIWSATTLVPDFTAADVSFNAHEVALNFSGLFAAGPGSVDIGFTTVPEPPSIITGLIGLAIAGRFGLSRWLRADG